MDRPKLNLHVADNVERLNQMAELSQKIKKSPITMLAKSTKTVLMQADKLLLDGDEENAYIFFMKYFTLINIIRTSEDYHKIKPIQREIFGTNNEIRKRMDTLEALKESLSKRYAEKRELHEAKFRQADAFGKKTVTANKNTVAAKQVTNFISCSELYSRIRDKNEKILLIDCRTEVDFQMSQIKYENLISIPAHIISNGLTSSKLSEQIAPQFLNQWKERGTMDLIVLIDDDTVEGQPDSTVVPIWILRSILIYWDPNTEYKSLLLLEGGFQKFVLYYPACTTNAKYSKPKIELPTILIADIEYPSLDRIKMKPKQSDIVSPKNILPIFDRSIKPTTFGHKTVEQESAISPIAIAREREKIIDQVLEKENEALKITDQLNNIVNAPTLSESEQGELFAKQTELEYKLVQKEQELNDTITMNVASQSEFEKDLQALDISTQNPEVSEAYARIKAKEDIHSENERKLKENSRKIEAKLNENRERQKRHLQSKEEEEDIIRPKQPSFDRSMKPNFELVRFPQIQRDFSPVYGSYGDIGATGLKNLGNTCYMNSIIQCLMNLEQLREYLCNGNYLRHINRKSKTRGQITEEFAQLCKQLWSGQYKSIAARDFRSRIGQEYKMFASYDQQDSHEFLVILLDVLHSELQLPMDDVILSKNAHKSEIAWREFSKNTESIIQRLFFGQIRSMLKCRTCEFESSTYEGFSHLSLELPQDNRQYRLHDCLDLYFNGEIIDGWTCPRCKQNRDAIKKLDISRLPPVLVIHLKRFNASLDTPNTYYKKQNFIYFPIIDFNVSDYIAPLLQQRRVQSQYNLFAVSNHYGTMNRGHYTAFCKNSNSKSWYKYDDDYVTHINEHEVNSSAGYILFYSQL